MRFFLDYEVYPDFFFFHMHRTGSALTVSDERLCIRYVSLYFPLEKTSAGCGP